IATNDEHRNGAKRMRIGGGMYLGEPVAEPSGRTTAVGGAAVWSPSVSDLDVTFTSVDEIQSTMFPVDEMATIYSHLVLPQAVWKDGPDMITTSGVIITFRKVVV
ncbi:MAG TPA: hypothetical protein VNE67_01790, partial [Acetobacteraceae bacterium]|nr:hypothetical protein [Acetobacteraceae bacterium]